MATANCSSFELQIVIQIMCCIHYDILFVLLRAVKAYMRI